MPQALYVGLQDDDKIAAFSIDPASGRLTPQAELAAPGGPSVMALGLDRRTLYVGLRGGPAITTFGIAEDGALTPAGTASQPHAPTFLAPDRSGRYLLCA